jgi:exodeoxyribonuclease VII large subunit
VISAVGHETDFTIVDFVADLRAPTPSAAAEMVIRSRQEIENQEENLRKRLVRAMRYQLLIRRQHLTEAAQHRAFSRMLDVIRSREQRLDDFHHRLSVSERGQLGRYRRRLEVASTALRHRDMRRVLTAIRRDLHAGTAALGAVARANLLRHRGRLERSDGRLRGLSPLSALDRGYALVFDAQGQIVKDAAQVKTGEDIRARLARGELTATVKDRG